MHALDSVSATTELLIQHDYAADGELSTNVFLVVKMAKALFLEDEPGVGKTETARVLILIIRNRTREIHDALKRRCVYTWIDHPSTIKGDCYGNCRRIHL